MGKSFGVTATGVDQEVVQRMMKMEQRDAQEAGELAAGVPTGVDDGVL